MGVEGLGSWLAGWVAPQWLHGWLAGDAHHVFRQTADQIVSVRRRAAVESLESVGRIRRITSSEQLTYVQCTGVILARSSTI